MRNRPNQRLRHRRLLHNNTRNNNNPTVHRMAATHRHRRKAMAIHSSSKVIRNRAIHSKAIHNKRLRLSPLA